MSDMSEGIPETEQERLSRECREMYDELTSKGLIEGTYAAWLEASAKKGAERLAPADAPRIILPSMDV